MKKNIMIGLVVIVAAIVVIAAACVVFLKDDNKESAVNDFSPGLHVYTLNEVEFFVQIPEPLSEGKFGMVIDVPGAGMTAEQQNAGSNMREIGPRYGYVVVQPVGPGNIMGLDTGDTMLEMIELLVDKLDIDEDHIHMTGFSAGGYFTWRFLRDYPDVLASAAPAAAAGIVGWGCTFSEDDMPTKQIPMMYMIGTQDGPYEASQIVKSNIIAEYGMDSGTIVSQDTTYKHIRYTNADGIVFEYIEHDYISSSLNSAGNQVNGHCMPGAESKDVEDPVYRYVADPPTTFNWGEEVMKFFMENPRA